MHKFIYLAALVFATQAFAQEQAEVELSEGQIATLAVLTPLAQLQVPGDTGVMLAECIMLSSKRRELRKFSKADPDEPGEAIVTLANKVIQRPAVAECLTARLSQ